MIKKLLAGAAVLAMFSNQAMAASPMMSVPATPIQQQSSQEPADPCLAPLVVVAIAVGGAAVLGGGYYLATHSKKRGQAIAAPPPAPRPVFDARPFANNVADCLTAGAQPIYQLNRDELRDACGLPSLGTVPTS